MEEFVVPSPINEITTLKPFVNKNDKKDNSFLSAHFLKRRV